MQLGLQLKHFFLINRFIYEMSENSEQYSSQVPRDHSQVIKCLFFSSSTCTQILTSNTNLCFPSATLSLLSCCVFFQHLNPSADVISSLLAVNQQARKLYITSQALPCIRRPHMTTTKHTKTTFHTETCNIPSLSHTHTGMHIPTGTETYEIQK